MTASVENVAQDFYHGTRVDLRPGDLRYARLHRSNYGQRKKASWVYFTATLDAAIWGAEPGARRGTAARSTGSSRPGHFSMIPTLPIKKFPGNPTKSYRSAQPLRIIGEAAEWQGHPPEQLQAMRDSVERSRQAGIEAIN